MPVTPTFPDHVSDAYVNGSLHLGLDTAAVPLENHASAETPERARTVYNASTQILLADCCRGSPTILQILCVVIPFTTVSEQAALGKRPTEMHTQRSYGVALKSSFFPQTEAIYVLAENRCPLTVHWMKHALSSTSCGSEQVLHCTQHHWYTTRLAPYLRSAQQLTKAF